jgi:hypothetical protein
VIWIERFAILVETLGLTVRQAGLTPMTVAAQRLQRSGNERIPIAVVLDNMIDLCRRFDVASRQAGAAQGLT